MNQKLTSYNDVEIFFNTITEKFEAMLPEEQGGETLVSDSLSGIKKMITQSLPDEDKVANVKQAPSKGLKLTYDEKKPFEEITLGAFGYLRGRYDSKSHLEVWVNGTYRRQRERVQNWDGFATILADTPENRKAIQEYIKLKKANDKKIEQLENESEAARKTLKPAEPTIPLNSLPIWSK